MSTMKKLQPNELPKPQKKVVAKVLVEQGFTTPQIEEWIGVDNVSVWRYAKEQTPENLKAFEMEFQASITTLKSKGVAIVHRRLLELIPRERRISEVVKAGEFLEGKTAQQTNIQNNIVIPNSLQSKYGVPSSPREDNTEQ